MAKQVLTIHQALCELKILDKRIKEASAQPVICANRANNKKIGGMTLEEVSSFYKGNFDRTEGLIKRRNAIKSAVSHSNASTMITVGGAEMSVANAIYENGEGYELKREVLDNFKSQYRSALNKLTVENGDKLNNKVENYIIATFGNSEKGNKTDEMVKAEEIYRANNSYDLVDPNKLKDKIDKGERELDAFKTEIDSALQISNATTTIEIDV